ncbi:TetR/AcrR family transcriptional regulator [Cellulomonas denverensis]|uniref:TetR/AcrR family transcriptional regulator n=1 Tax=Cellulomonas denverensis TaxID=264297 RepID=A0A7X6KXX5_9CELL|nr:TetR/AcrR family transcriptional regulator [Cellulomonas denverensis]NKY24239.1 TetR/AcrR family transcriptional regulator [Cellulomonas denverensis]GIG24844.1 TetR family transcriptional regulator [Cellulomonas denverensis]
MSAPKRTPKARPETLERRKDILRAAMATFGSKGYKNGPLTEIAEQVDMTHAGILHHFGSKDQLLLEVLKYRDSSDVEDFQNQRIPDGIDLFRHLIRTAFANEGRPGIVQAYAVLSAESVTDDHPARDYFQERYTTLRREIREAFEQICRERGIDEPDTIDRAAAAILAVMDGLQVQWLLDRENVELAETSAFAIEALVAAVIGPESGI